MQILMISVYVSEDDAYRVKPGYSYEDAARELLKAKLHRLVDTIVDNSKLDEDGADRTYRARKFEMRLGINKKEDKK